MSNAGLLIKAKSTLEEIYNVIENIHLKLIAENSLPLVDQIILDCEYALISINSINFKIKILMMDGINKVQTNSALIKSLFCEFFNKLQLICEEEKEQLKQFFTQIVCDVELFNKKFSTLILQLVETFKGTDPIQTVSLINSPIGVQTSLQSLEENNGFESTSFFPAIRIISLVHSIQLPTLTKKLKNGSDLKELFEELYQMIHELEKAIKQEYYRITQKREIGNSKFITVLSEFVVPITAASLKTKIYMENALIVNDDGYDLIKKLIEDFINRLKHCQESSNSIIDFFRKINSIFSEYSANSSNIVLTNIRK